MVKNLSKTGKIGLAALALGAVFVALGGLYLWVQPASALALSNRRDTLQTSIHGQLSRHTFLFTTATALTTDSLATADFSIVLNYPTNAAGDPYGTSVPAFVAADATLTATSCGAKTFAVTDIEESSNGGAAANDEFLVAINDTAQNSTNVIAGCVMTLTFGASSGAQRLTNPADDAAGCTAGATSADADICRITVQTSETITGVSPAIVDNGDVLVAHISGVAVSVTVAETLSFQINAETNANCDTQFSVLGGPDSSSSAVQFGTISATDTLLHACQFLKVTTNASGGYVVTAEEDTSLNRTGAGDLTIDDAICNAATPCTSSTEGAWTTATRNGFGYSCKTKTGTTLCNFTTETTNYKAFACQSGTAADCDPVDGPLAKQNVMTGSATSDNQVYIEYKLSVGVTQPSGTYDNTITYIAAPTF